MAQRLLVIDDEEPILFAFHEYFTTNGYKVDCARELEEAQALPGTVACAAVIADLRLTGSHGAEGLQIISFLRERCPETRIILLTAYGSPEVTAEARWRGVDAFLHKPKPLREVAQIVYALVGARLEGRVGSTNLLRKAPAG